MDKILFCEKKVLSNLFCGYRTSLRKQRKIFALIDEKLRHKKPDQSITFSKRFNMKIFSPLISAKKKKTTSTRLKENLEGRRGEKRKALRLTSKPILGWREEGVKKLPNQPNFRNKKSIAHFNGKSRRI